MLDNPHGFPVEYEWSLSSPVFTVSPLTGTVKPRSSCQVSVKWTPGSAAGGAAPKAARQQPLEGAAAASEGSPSQAAPKAASSGAGVSRKLSKTGSVGASAANRAATAAAAGAPSQSSGRSPSRPQSKESTSKQPSSTSVPGVAMPGSAAQQSSASPAASARGAAAANGPSVSGGSSSIPTNNSSITVELPADAVAPPPAAAASVGCQHTGYMTLKLKGGGDVPPKKVMLYGELPASMLKFASKELNLGPVPLFEQQTTLVQVKNAGSTDAAFRVSVLRPVFTSMYLSQGMQVACTCRCRQGGMHDFAQCPKTGILSGGTYTTLGLCLRLLTRLCLCACRFYPTASCQCLQSVVRWLLRAQQSWRLHCC